MTPVDANKDHKDVQLTSEGDDGWKAVVPC